MLAMVRGGLIDAGGSALARSSSAPAAATLDGKYKFSISLQTDLSIIDYPSQDIDVVGGSFACGEEITAWLGVPQSEPLPVRLLPTSPCTFVIGDATFTLDSVEGSTIRWRREADPTGEAQLYLWERQVPSSLKCQHGHPVDESGTDSRSRANCDVCSGRSGQPCAFRCSQRCNWDCCVSCFDENKGARAPAEELLQGGQVLAMLDLLERTVSLLASGSALPLPFRIVLTTSELTDCETAAALQRLTRGDASEGMEVVVAELPPDAPPLLANLPGRVVALRSDDCSVRIALPQGGGSEENFAVPYRCLTSKQQVPVEDVEPAWLDYVTHSFVAAGAGANPESVAEPEPEAETPGIALPAGFRNSVAPAWAERDHLALVCRTTLL